MLLDMQSAARCGAKTRSGKPCQSPGMPNGRCRMHGGPSPGAPKGNQNAYKHGRYSAEAIARRREISALIRAAQALKSACCNAALSLLSHDPIDYLNILRQPVQ